MGLGKSIKKRAKKLGIKLGLITPPPPPPKTHMDNSEVESDRQMYISLNKDEDFLISREFDYICKGDKYINNGVRLDDEIGYFVQDIWGARKVFKERMRRFFNAVEASFETKDSINSSKNTESNLDSKEFYHNNQNKNIESNLDSKHCHKNNRAQNNLDSIKNIESIFKNSPALRDFVHYDVGSRVDGFIAHLLTFNQKVCLIDIRPMDNLESAFLSDKNNGGGG